MKIAQTFLFILVCLFSFQTFAQKMDYLVIQTPIVFQELGKSGFTYYTDGTSFKDLTGGSAVAIATTQNGKILNISFYTFEGVNSQNRFIYGSQIMDSVPGEALSKVNSGESKLLFADLHHGLHNTNAGPYYYGHQQKNPSNTNPQDPTLNASAGSSSPLTPETEQTPGLNPNEQTGTGLDTPTIQSFAIGAGIVAGAAGLDLQFHLEKNAKKLADAQSGLDQAQSDLKTTSETYGQDLEAALGNLQKKMNGVLGVDGILTITSDQKVFNFDRFKKSSANPWSGSKIRIINSRHPGFSANIERMRSPFFENLIFKIGKRFPSFLSWYASSAIAFQDFLFSMEKVKLLEVLPFTGEFIDFYQFASGRNFYDSSQLTPTERFISGTAVFVSMKEVMGYGAAEDIYFDLLGEIPGDGSYDYYRDMHEQLKMQAPAGYELNEQSLFKLRNDQKILKDSLQKGDVPEFLNILRGEKE